MDDTYSTYDAKAKFSAILAKGRRGRTVDVSYRGKPVTEICPIRPAAEGLDDRLETLARMAAWLRRRRTDQLLGGKPIPISS